VAVWLMDGFDREQGKLSYKDATCVAILPCCETWQQKAGSGVITWEGPTRTQTVPGWSLTVYLGNTEISHCPFCDRRFSSVTLWNSPMVSRTTRVALRRVRKMYFERGLPC